MRFYNNFIEPQNGNIHSIGSSSRLSKVIYVVPKYLKHKTFIIKIMANQKFVIKKNGLTKVRKEDLKSCDNINMVRFLCVGSLHWNWKTFLPSYCTKCTFFEIMDVFENHGYLSQKFCGNPDKESNDSFRYSKQIIFSILIKMCGLITLLLQRVINYLFTFRVCWDWSDLFCSCNVVLSFQILPRNLFCKKRNIQK